MWAALAPFLLVLVSVSSEDGAGKKVERVVHQEEDFRAPDFDFSKLEVVFSGMAEVPGCPQEKQHIIVYEYIYKDQQGNIEKTNLTTVNWEDIVTETFHNGEDQPWVSTIRPRLNCLEQDDPELVRTIKSIYLVPPTSTSKYNLSSTQQVENTGWWGDGQARTLDQTYFHEQKKGGFFVEAGAFDGATDSTSLHFEMAHQWSGLLVEPVSRFFSKIASKGRRTWSINTCLSTTSRPQTISWADEVNSLTMQGVVEGEIARTKTNMMQCFPLYTLLLALGNPTVDFLSLDVEGPELEVLETIPWAKVDIRAISVETEFLSLEKREKVFNLLISNGFTHLTALARDDIFVRLQEGGHSPKQKGAEVLLRKIPRLCQYFRVKDKDLSKHCINALPRDFFRPKPRDQIPNCVLEDQCWWTLKAIAGTYRYTMPFKTQLMGNGCGFTISDGSPLYHPRFWAPQNF